MNNWTIEHSYFQISAYLTLLYYSITIPYQNLPTNLHNSQSHPPAIQVYLPSSLLVVATWGSFLVPPDMVPARLILLVCTLPNILIKVQRRNLNISKAKPIWVKATLDLCILRLAPLPPAVASITVTFKNIITTTSIDFQLTVPILTNKK